MPEAHIQGHEFHQVKVPYEHPYTAIGIVSGITIDQYGRRHPSFGSGALISEKFVLTCAHNVYHGYDERRPKIPAQLVQ